MNKLVSIIIPYYKKKRYIKKSLNSIYNQTYKNFEIIIIYDDTDLSDLNFVKKIIKKKYKTKLIINKKNLGAGLSRNKGIKVAKGEYIAFLDADDFWSKNKLKYQVNYMEKRELNFSFTSYFIIKVKNTILKKIEAKSLLLHKELINSCDIGLSTVILKKKILKNLKFPNLKTKEDYVLWLKISLKNTLYGINKPLTFWRLSDGSLSSSSLQKIKDAFLVYYDYLKFNFVKSVYCVIVLSLNFIKKRYL